ncbi:hypothetical protein JTB14_036315 [Gonioctena quinquepunctata]|nr:hypothetical protein JTB14_036315 [Gonioctena quinquepunctata]
MEISSVMEADVGGMYCSAYYGITFSHVWALISELSLVCHKLNEDFVENTGTHTALSSISDLFDRRKAFNLANFEVLLAELKSIELKEMLSG